MCQHHTVAMKKLHQLSAVEFFIYDTSFIRFSLLFLTLPTEESTLYARISSASYGLRSPRTLSLPESLLSHSASSCGRRMTGMRLWMSAMRLLGSVVIMVQVDNLFPSGPIQVSYNPAKENIESSFIKIRIGCFPDPVFRHS